MRVLNIFSVLNIVKTIEKLGFHTKYIPVSYNLSSQPSCLWVDCKISETSDCLRKIV